MASINTYLQRILDAVYGEEVRGSIHDAIKAMNEESSSAMQYASTAKDSAQAAAISASGSATMATQKATDAANSAIAAKASETNTKASETNAANFAFDASLRAKEALASEAAARAAHAGAETAKKSAEEASVNLEAVRTAMEKSAIDAAASAESARYYSGKPPQPINGTWWIWDMERYQELCDSNGNLIEDSSGDPISAKYPGYVDTHISCELQGPIGIGIEDIQLTSGNHAPGTTDIYTVLLTDGTSYPISVYNGRNGEGIGDVCGIDFDLTIPANGWANGEAKIADGRLLASTVYKYFIAASAASRKEFLDCKVEPTDITTTGFITFTSETTPTSDLTVRLIRFEFAANS